MKLIIKKLLRHLVLLLDYVPDLEICPSRLFRSVRTSDERLRAFHFKKDISKVIFK